EDVAATSAFARGTSSSETRFGTAAAEAGSNGLWATDESPSRRASARGGPSSAIATDTAAAATSDPIRTRRRSNRSPIQPASGAEATDATTLEKIAADTQTAEWVRP